MTPHLPSPLAGLCIAVTRSRATAGRIAGLLEERGASLVCVPAIRTEPPEDTGPLDRAAASLASYDWIAFTSALAVRPLLDRVPGGVLPPVPRVAVVGPATARELIGTGRAPDLVPDRHNAQGLAEALRERIRGQVAPGAVVRVLFPAGELARDVLERDLPGPLEPGGPVVELHRVTTYRTVPDPDPGDLERLPEADWLLLTAPSAARALVAKAGPRLRRDLPVACMGPATSEEAAALGLDVRVVAEDYSLDGLVAALERAVAAC